MRPPPSKRAAILAIALGLVQAACGAEPPALSPTEAAQSIQMPAGFRVTLFAGEPDVQQPIAFCLDDRGRLWVAEGHAYPTWKPEGNDKILIFEDTDGDGKFDRRTVFHDRLNYVTGIEVGFGGVWIVSAPHLLFIPDKDGDDTPDGPPVALLDGFGHEGIHNLVNGFTWGPDGWLYGGHGGSSYSKLGRPGTPEGERVHFDGGVWRYHPTRHVVEGFAEGTTNPWGVDFNEVGQAFISNCVTPHLYHVVQGAHFQRRRSSPLSRHAYGQIENIADHRHWVGSEWNKSGGGQLEQLAAGGGHAHAGVLVYLGDSFPASYRGSVFMVNIHGKRLNNDRLERQGSGYVARHEKDFFLSGDRRFLGVGLQTGPDGAIYVSDWNDPDECHTRKPDRATGRIFKVSHDDPASTSVSPAKLSDLELARLQLSRNEWLVRHARRLLQERAPGGIDPAAREELRKILDTHPDVTRKLRALWALHVTGGLSPERLRKLLDSSEEHLRAWAIQLELEDRQVSSAVLRKFVVMAAADPSPVVRLYLAAAGQRLPLDQRWALLERLAARDEDVADHNLPLMIWYAAEPLAEKDAPRALALVVKSKLPKLREFMARRVAAIAR